ncbi:MAG: GTP-binding protein, partial [Candidatus Freyarchaeota archaeon]
GENFRTEFKRYLKAKDLSPKRKQKLIAQLKYITSEGEGNLYVGVEDINDEKWEVFGLTEEDTEISDFVLRRICQEAGITIAHKKIFNTDKGLVTRYVLVTDFVLRRICQEAGITIAHKKIFNTDKGLVTRYVLVRTPTEELQDLISIGFAGRVNSGKSTLIGVLMGNKLDNGRGSARAYLLKHPQELEKGQTADLHFAFIGLNHNNEITPLENPLNPEERARVLDHAKRIINFVDAPGHSEYVKTMIRAILGSDSQYGVILIPAMASKETPFIVLISKVDQAKPPELERVREVIRQTIKNIGRLPVWVRDDSDVKIVQKEINHRVIVPVIEVSSVTGGGLDLLKKILATLPSRINQELILKPALAYIDKVYLGIRGTNVVVTGTVKQGMFKPEQKVKIGPDENGEFFEGRIATVEVFKERVQRVKAGDIFGFDVKRIDPKKLRRGQVISDVDMELRACRFFEANIVVTRHPAKISVGYSPVLQTNTIHQTVVFEEIEGRDYLVVGDFAKVKLRMKYYPEFLRVGDRIVTREGSTRTIGRVTKILE